MSLRIDMDIMLNGRDNQTDFTTQLLHLIFKADNSNTEKLKLGFPNAVKTVQHFRRTGDILDLESD